MRWIALVLGCTTLLFAGLAWHFWRAADASASWQPSTAARVAALSPAAEIAPERVATGDETSAPLVDDRSLRLAANAVLSDAADPVARQGLIDAEKLMIAGRSPRLAQQLGLTDEESDRFLTLLAEQSLGYREDHARCTVDPRCNFRGFEDAQVGKRQREIADFLGPERGLRYADYQRTLMERQMVTSLRSTLSDADYLPEPRAEDLIDALADERSRMQRESAQRNVGLIAFGTEAGMVYADADTRTLDERLESARKYSARLRERASAVLTPEQSRAFDRVQDQLIAGMRASLRSPDRD